MSMLPRVSPVLGEAVEVDQRREEEVEPQIVAGEVAGEGEGAGVDALAALQVGLSRIHLKDGK